MVILGKKADYFSGATWNPPSYVYRYTQVDDLKLTTLIGRPSLSGWGCPQVILGKKADYFTLLLNIYYPTLYPKPQTLNYVTFCPRTQVRFVTTSLYYVTTSSYSFTTSPFGPWSKSPETCGARQLLESLKSQCSSILPVKNDVEANLWEFLPFTAVRSTCATRCNMKYEIWMWHVKYRCNMKYEM